MRTFIQFKDGIAASYVRTMGATDGVEVFTDNPDQFLGKKLQSDGTWVSAEEIKYALINEDGNISEIRKTFYPSVVGDNPIMGAEVKPNWKWNGKEWVAPPEILTEL
jgi:hypothetical protein